MSPTTNATQNAEIIDVPSREVSAPEMQASAALPSLFGSDNPAVAFKRMQEIATVITQPIRDMHMYAPIGDKDYLTVEAWQLIGGLVGVTSRNVWSRPVTTVGGSQGWEAREEAITIDGRVVGSAESMCVRAEERWDDADDHALRSMAQTRAQSKALSRPLRFIAILAGFSGTPYEEANGTRGGSRKDDNGLAALFDSIEDKARWDVVKNAGYPKGFKGGVSGWLRKLEPQFVPAVRAELEKLLPASGEPGSASTAEATSHASTTSAPSSPEASRLNIKTHLFKMTKEQRDPLMRNFGWDQKQLISEWVDARDAASLPDIWGAIKQVRGIVDESDMPSR